MNFKIICTIFLFSCLLLLVTETSYALSIEPILITSSPDMDQILFDGKWTFFKEWKSSSLNRFTYDDDMTIILRTAHQENFIYFYVEVINDFILNKGMDKVTICIDSNNNKNIIPDDDDFCFSSTLGNKQGVVFQGGSVNGVTGNFQQSPNPENFIGIGNISDENSRYEKIPHPSYEFRIPIELIQRSDNYGFYLSVYEAQSQKFYSWPKDSMRENFFEIPSPVNWGDIISPDKSLPEINLPIIVLLISILVTILIPFKTKNLISRF